MCSVVGDGDRLIAAVATILSSLGGGVLGAGFDELLLVTDGAGVDVEGGGVVGCDASCCCGEAAYTVEHRIIDVSIAFFMDKSFYKNCCMINDCVQGSIHHF